MSWQFASLPLGTPPYVDGTWLPETAIFEAIAADLSKRGATIDGGAYGRANTGYLVLNKGELAGATFSVTAASWTSGTVTLTIGPHNIQTGQRISVSGVTPTGYNTPTDSVVVSGVGSTTVQFALSTNPGAYSSGGTALVGGAAAAEGMLCHDIFGNLRLYSGGVWGNVISALAATLNGNGQSITGLGFLTFANGVSAGGGLASSIAANSTIANTTALTTFSHTYNIAANSLTVGMIVRIRANGYYSTTGSPTISLGISVGGATVASFSGLATITNAANQGWALEADVLINTIGSSGFLLAGVNRAATGAANNPAEYPGSGSLNTTIANAVAVTAQWSAASASNTITMQTMSIELIPVGGIF